VPRSSSAEAVVAQSNTASAWIGSLIFEFMSDTPLVDLCARKLNFSDFAALTKS
jgi:hypothetical protein